MELRIAKSSEEQMRRKYYNDLRDSGFTVNDKAISDYVSFCLSHNQLISAGTMIEDLMQLKDESVEEAAYIIMEASRHNTVHGTEIGEYICHNSIDEICNLESCCDCECILECMSSLTCDIWNGNCDEYHLESYDTPDKIAKDVFSYSINNSIMFRVNYDSVEHAYDFISNKINDVLYKTKSETFIGHSQQTLFNDLICKDGDIIQYDSINIMNLDFLKEGE